MTLADFPDDWSLAALCVWREARGEPYAGKLAVAFSIRNRVNKPRWWGHDWRSVILKPFQYSSFNVNDPNSKLFPGVDDKAWQECLAAVGAVMSGRLEDNTGGATHYCTLDSNPPWWATATPTVVIGNHKFAISN